jgi:hypothetical protein
MGEVCTAHKCRNVNNYNTFFVKTNWGKRLERYRPRWNYNNKMDLRKLRRDILDRINLVLVLYRDQR